MRRQQKPGRQFGALLKVAAAIAVLFFIRIIWTTMRPWKQPEFILDEIDQDTQHFQGQSCVMKNGKCVPYSEEPEERMSTKGLQTKGNSFYLDGKPFRILSGSFHYFRTQPAQWGDRLFKMKAAGLNTVMTYIPWNLHEKVKNQINFAGKWDLSAFITQAQNVGLKVIIRPGPYICAEWEYGGLPSWLMSHQKMKVRSSKSQTFLFHVGEYLSKVIPILAAFSYSQGKGPIIAYQLENEFGSYGDDQNYLLHLKSLFTKYGVRDLIFTSDGKTQDGSYGFIRGSLPGVLKTANFVQDPDKNLNALLKVQPDKPLMVTEFWSGWFDHWGEKHHHFTEEELKKSVKAILSRGASINFYMFVGGTNFAFWNGANNGSDYKPTITSYDYDAPISEHGDLTPKYHAIRQIIMDMKLAPHDLPDRVPPNPEKTSYGVLKMLYAMPYKGLLKLLLDMPKYRDLRPMEMIDVNNKGGQGYGWIVYRTYIPKGSELEIRGMIKDRAQVILNHREIKVLSWKDKELKISLRQEMKENNTLDIFVENMGRVNFVDFLNDQRKGIIGDVYLDNKKLVDWIHYPLEFKQSLRNSLSLPSVWGPYTPYLGPAAYKGSFKMKGEPKDTFLSMEGWNKGIVLVNGINIGRYWNLGPQKTLYVPAPLLTKRRNEVTVFELHKGHKSVTFTDKPDLG